MPRTTSPIRNPVAAAVMATPRTRQSLRSGFGSSLPSFTAEHYRRLLSSAGMSGSVWVELMSAESDHTSVVSLARYAGPPAEALARWQDQNDPARRR